MFSKEEMFVTLASALVLVACASDALTAKAPLLVSGDACTIKETGQPGKCTLISECADVLEAAFQGVIPQICSFVGTVSVVCCPVTVDMAGSACTVRKTGKGGVCRPFADCPAAIQAATHAILPQICEHHGSGQELICCEDDCPALPRGTVTQKKTGSKAADYCIGLAEKAYPCRKGESSWTRKDQCPPKPDPTMVFSDTPLNVTTELPHWVMLGSGESFDVSWTCHGSLISEQWVLCSSWCLDHDSELEYVGLGGSFNPYTRDLVRNIKRKIKHPGFNKGYTWVYNNIALLELDSPVTFTRRILPACLHTGGPVPAEGLVIVGWHVEIERYVMVTEDQVSEADCTKDVIQDTTYFPEGLGNSSLVCARPRIPSGKCGLFGSGTPLQVHNGDQVACTYLLFGISTAYRRALCMDVYTRVDAFLPWIEGYVWP